MPTYEYECTGCKHAWEAEQSMKDDPLVECPSCKGSTAKRQISVGTGFILKGGGATSSGTSVPASPSGGTTAEGALHKRFEQVSGIKFGDK